MVWVSTNEATTSAAARLSLAGFIGAAFGARAL